MIKDMTELMGSVDSIVPAVITTDTDGASADLLGYDGALIVAHIGISGDTLGASLHTQIEVEESEDDSTFTDVADADLTDTVTGDNTGTICKIDAAAEDPAVHTSCYLGSKRYIRAVDNITGTHSNGTPICVSIHPFNYKYPPVA